ncbi:MAG: methyltransferase domain-containing protein, partial [Burkholderiaceae bacterium]|nr:methyltransferase domain-containing protein [Burkholderiaceae bacterium]
WFDSPPGRYLLAWEQLRFDEAVADLFGYQSLQLGMPCLDTLRANRMPCRWLALGQEAASAEVLRGPSSVPDWQGAEFMGALPRLALLAESVALPFADRSLDLLVLPHALEFSPDPHATLREVERVLVPEGRVVISGLNPLSLWGLCQWRAHWAHRWGRGPSYVPHAAEFIGYRRLRDWLRLLNFEVESARFGCYRPALRSQDWLERFGWMDRLGAQWWPVFGAAYFVVAIKRVHGMRLMEPSWRTAKPRSAAAMPLAHRSATRPLGPDRP